MATFSRRFSISRPSSAAHDRTFESHQPLQRDLPDVLRSGGHSRRTSASQVTAARLQQLGQDVSYPNARDDAQTLGPLDSISQYDEPPHQGRNPFQEDLYAGDHRQDSRFSRQSGSQAYPTTYDNYNDAVDPRAERQSGFANDEHYLKGKPYSDTRDSAPLMDPRQQRRDYDEESFMDGDTVVGSRKDYKQSREDVGDYRSDSYPPVPYDSLHEKEEEPKPTLMSTLKGRKQQKKRPNVWLRQLRDTSSTEDKIENHKRGIGVQDRPWACWLFILICTVVFIVELVKSAQLTGKAIQTSPFNWMVGPSSELLIHVGARFSACMRDILEISSQPFACLNSTSSSATTAICSLEDICGFGGFGANGKPNQTFRFFTPIWLHVGVIHLVLNMLVLYQSSGLVEKQMGTLKFLVLYLLSGAFGFIMGGNFALTGVASMGASGAIFGTHAAVLVDLIAHWSIIDRPKRLLFALIFEIIIGIALGYIPGIDNFSHIGGLAIGILLSIALLPMIHQTRLRRITVFFIRSLAFVAACVMFGVLLNNFFTQDPNAVCEWCRYLSCWPTNSNNHCRGTGLKTTETTTQGTVGSQNNVSLIALYLITFFSGSHTLRRCSWKSRASAVSKR